MIDVHAEVGDSNFIQLFGCGAALVATLLEAYTWLEVLRMCASLVFKSKGMRPNSRESRSGPLPSFQEVSLTP